MEWRRPLERPAARLARAAGLVLVGVSLAWAAWLVLLPFLVHGLVRSIDLFVAGCVWLATSIAAGASIWSVLRTITGALTAAVVTRAASAVLAGLVLILVVASYLLQRLLGSEEESSR